MTEIPEDVMERAKQVLAEVYNQEHIFDRKMLIASAIMAAKQEERERCAQVAKLAALRSRGETRKTKNLGLRRNLYFHEIGDYIATAIRKGEHNG